MLVKGEKRKNKGLKFSYKNSQEIAQAVDTFLNRTGADTTREKYSLSEEGSSDDLLKLTEHFDIIVIFDSSTEQASLLWDPNEAIPSNDQRTPDDDDLPD